MTTALTERRKRFVAALLASAVVAACTTEHAPTPVDGDWCAGDGNGMGLRLEGGTAVLTDGDVRWDGDYVVDGERLSVAWATSTALDSGEVRATDVVSASPYVFEGGRMVLPEMNGYPGWVACPEADSARLFGDLSTRVRIGGVR